MKWPLQLLAMVLAGQALMVLAARRSLCSCDCCETAASREQDFPGGMQCSFAQPKVTTAPRCDSLCAKHADDATIESAQSLLDTERFCFVECVPGNEDLRAGDTCRPMSFEERKSSRGEGNIRLPKPSAVQHLRKKSWQTVLAREPKKPEAPKAWASLEASDMEKALKDGKKAATKAMEEAKAVQQASYAGFSVVSKAARAEEDARKAAVMAMNTEEKVRKVLDMAKIEAHAEAFGVLKEVLPPMQQAARAAAKASAMAGPGSESEEAQKRQVLATSKAAADGMKPWSDAMQNAVKVRDAYASRGKELAEASLAAERNAQYLEKESRAWQTVQTPQAERKASNLHSKAQEFMATASENDERANKYFDIARSIDGSLPSYSQQAEQGAYHAMAMVSPDIPAPLPPLAMVQTSEK
ncbi:unnamed protein product [Symbiodinium microadriaticum]|nr:unnamed protein product [Symbiodinium microadriaticum]CAE7845294.1 unnamed protein product [Symbiodinium sp. KB8]